VLFLDGMGPTGLVPKYILVGIQWIVHWWFPGHGIPLFRALAHLEQKSFLNNFHGENQKDRRLGASCCQP